MWYSSKKNDLELVFIYDKLMLDKLQSKLKMNLEFVSFGYIKGYKLFHYRKSIVAMKEEDAKGKRLNDKVFGSVYKVPSFSYTSLKIDAYYYCSQARLGYTSLHDMRERITDTCHLFELDSAQQLISHQYKSDKKTTCQMYIGNKLDDRLISHINYGRYRLVDGIDVPSYKKLLVERGIEC